MKEVKLFYDSQGINNYICVKAEEPLRKFQVKMLECNEIPGLLAMHGTVMNGVCKLHFDITKMQRLSDILGDEIKGNQAKKLLLDILKALLTAEEYLLSFNRCVLHPDYIFVKPDSKVGMVYLPYEEKEITSVDDIRTFYQRLLVDYLTDDNDMFFLNLLKYVNKQEFSLAGLLEKLEEGMEETPAPQTASSQEASTRRAPEPIREEKKEAPSKPIFEFMPKKEKTEEKKPLVDFSGLGFMVPGMENKPEKKEEKKTVEKEPQEKKGSLLGGLLGSGKKSTELKTAEREFKIPGLFEKKAEQPKTSVSKAEERTYTAPAQQNVSGWSGTVMLEAESAKTEMLGVQSAPQLIHNGNSITVAHFPFRIGNGKVEVDYAIPKGVISRNHASIQCSQGKYYIKDENSSNHTYLNGRQLPPYTEMEISSGDVIRLANEEMTFQE